jgi:uncharacterized membrane protein
MIRKQLMQSRGGGEADFRWRGHEVTRLEGFTDAVFAFAVTLLVVSLEVPKTFPELMAVLRGFFAFGICFSLLAFVWYEHYRFFRRYGLENPWAVALNCALLFFVLFYVYPLKFTFSSMFSAQQFSLPDMRVLFTIFSLGWTAVFLVFALLYQHAWTRRAELALTPIELLRTRASLTNEIAMILIGLLSTLLAWLLPAAWIGAAGFIYFGVGVYFTIAGSFWDRRERALRAGGGSQHS